VVVRTPSKLVVTILAAALALAGCGEEKRASQGPDRGRPPSTETTTPPSSASPTETTVVPRTAISVPDTPPPGPPTTPPPPITVPLTAVPTTDAPQPPPTEEPAPPTTDEPPVTTDPPTSTTRPRKPTRRSIVFTPDGAPRRKGTIVIPKGEHSEVMVVLVHGGDGTDGNRNDLRGWQDFYADHDIPSIAIDYFLPKPSTPPPVFPRPQTDVRFAVQWVRDSAAFLQVDPDRVIVQGFEAGAALAAQVYVQPDTSSPAAVPTPVAGFVGFAGRYDGQQSNPEQYYGGPSDDPDPEVQARYAQANAIANAAGATGPAMLFQAAGGSPELVAQAQAFDDALRTAGIDTELVLVEGATDDGFDTSGRELTPAGEIVAARVVDWLTTTFAAS
jgi:acetyl esterase/lipase